MTVHNAAPRPPGGLLDELLTPPAVAQLLGVSPPTVYAALRRRAGLSHIRTPGGQIRVRRRDVLAYCHKTGLPVPRGLVPLPEAVIVHPDRKTCSRLARLLQGVSASSTSTDPVDALVKMGASTPSLVMLSDALGGDLIDRVSSALSPSGKHGYVCVLRLVPGKVASWEGGVVPRPLDVGESSGRALPRLVGVLLGTG